MASPDRRRYAASRLKNLLSYPFANWLRPVLFACLTLPLLLLSMAADVGLFNVLAFTLFIISVSLLFISLIFLLFKKQWSKSFYTFIFIITIAIIIGLMG